MPKELKWGVSLAVGVGLLWVGWKVPVFLTAFFVLLSFVLIVIILLQSGSAADLAGAFGGAGSQTAFGPRSAATFLTQATAWCAVMFMLAALLLSIRSSTGATGINSVLQHTSKSQPAPAAPQTPPPAPKPAVPTLPVQQAPPGPTMPPGGQKPAPAAPIKH